MDGDATRRTRARYNRLAPAYDLQEAVVERLAFRRWREQLWSQVDGCQILEVGVGTGKNIPYHPEGTRVAAIDLSEGMLAGAQRRAQELGAGTDLALTDAQRLPFPDDAFDTAVATFVFCSVADPIQGLQELRRVVGSGGHIILLEHVRVNLPVIGWLMDAVDSLVVRLMGAHVNRTTTENVKKAGLEIEHVKRLLPGGLVKLIVAQAQ